MCDQNIDTHYDRQCQGVNPYNSTQDTFQYQQCTTPNLKILTTKLVTVHYLHYLQPTAYKFYFNPSLSVPFSLPKWLTHLNLLLTYLFSYLLYLISYLLARQSKDGENRHSSLRLCFWKILSSLFIGSYIFTFVYIPCEIAQPS